ncbi:MAG: hypothetical protein J2P52_02865 [Blastocatellia bacterium]|nr:hypothetical protein [Blastocatellia bacterium]
MPLQFILPLIASLLLYQSGAVSADSRSKLYEDAEAYEVYAAILPTDWLWQVQKAKSLVIQSETKVYKMCLRPDGESEKIVGPAISEYVRLNEKTWLLQQRLNIEKQYEFIASDDLKSIFKQPGGWERFHTQYPDSGGWIELSAVGFNADKTVAVVYAGHHCGGLCGGGGFHILQKKDGKWAPLKWNGKSCSWVS